MYADTPKQFNKTKRYVDIIIHIGVFLGDKSGFVRLAIFKASTGWYCLNTLHFCSDIAS